MNKLSSLAFVTSLTLASWCASAGEMSNDERSELRQRADTFQSERARNPDFQPGEGRLSPPRGELRPDQHKSKVRTKATKGAKTAKVQRSETKTERKKTKRGRSLKNLPGAFVR